ncbi:MAG: hypothetical protein ACK5G7_00395 [Erysipelotrichaceae bacterium]
MHGSWYGNEVCRFGGFFSLWSIICMIGILLLIIGIIVYFRNKDKTKLSEVSNNYQTISLTNEHSDVIKTLKQRLANGEIDISEYDKLKTKLEEL